MIVRQTHARHILIKTNELVPEAEARRRLESLKERLDNKADFAELARLHSEDASASKGGDLGWLSPGDTVPEFERAMNALKPGEISAAGADAVRLAPDPGARAAQRGHVAGAPAAGARTALRARKSDESYQEWVRQLRDRAYVEYRLEER